MITGCDVTEAVGRLASQLRPSAIPDDYAPQGAYWEVMLDVRGRFTNYGSLLDALPHCPRHCAIAESVGGPVGPGCFNYDLAHDKLRTDARWLAWYLFASWRAKKGADAEVTIAAIEPAVDGISGG